MHAEPTTGTEHSRPANVGRAALTLLAALVAAAAGVTLSTSIALAMPLPFDSVVVYLVAYVVGAAVPAVLVAWSWPSPAGRTIAFRVGAVVFAVACLVTALWMLLASFGAFMYVGAAFWVSIGGLAAGLALGLVQALAPGVVAPFGPLGRGARLGVAALCLAIVLGLGHDAFAHAIEEYRDQELPRSTLELVAAYPFSTEAPPGRMPAVVVDGSGRIGDVVTLGGQRFNLHRDDALRIEPEQVRRVRWLGDDEGQIVTIRLAAAAREAFEARQGQRTSQYDALLVDGEPVTTVFYAGGWDQIVLGGLDEAELRQAYERLTGEAPP